MAIIQEVKKKVISMTLEEVMLLILKEHGITMGTAEMQIDGKEVLVFHQENIR